MTKTSRVSNKNTVFSSYLDDIMCLQIYIFFTVITSDSSLNDATQVAPPAGIVNMVPITGTVTALTGTMNTARKSKRATVQTPSVVNEPQGKFTCNAYALLVEFIPSPAKC